MPRRHAIAQLCLAVLLAAFAPLRGHADDYPSRPIHLIITTPAGSLVDVLGRLYAEAMSARLGQPIVVDNRSGGMTMLGTDVLSHADPDGYTLMIGPSELTMLPFLKKDYRYEPNKDYTPVALVTSSWTVFAIYPGLPVKTLPEFIAYAKANPGKLRYGSGGVGGALHIAVEELKLKTGIDLVHVPYRGGGQAATDAMAGQIDMVSLGLASARVAEGGKLLILVERLDRATAEVEQQQSFRDNLAKIGCAPAYLPHAAFAAFIADDLKKWRQLIPAMGIPPIE